jgi:hypothetical protein
MPCRGLLFPEPHPQHPRRAWPDLSKQDLKFPFRALVSDLRPGCTCSHSRVYRARWCGGLPLALTCDPNYVSYLASLASSAPAPLVSIKLPGTFVCSTSDARLGVSPAIAGCRRNCRGSQRGKTSSHQPGHQVLLQSGRKDPSVHRFYECCGFEPGSCTAYVAGAHEAVGLCSSHIASRKPWQPTLLTLSQKSRLAQKVRIS